MRPFVKERLKNRNYLNLIYIENLKSFGQIWIVKILLIN